MLFCSRFGSGAESFMLDALCVVKHQKHHMDMVGHNNILRNLYILIKII